MVLCKTEYVWSCARQFMFVRDTCTSSFALTIIKNSTNNKELKKETNTLNSLTCNTEGGRLDTWTLPSSNIGAENRWPDVNGIPRWTTAYEGAPRVRFCPRSTPPSPAPAGDTGRDPGR